MTLSSLPIIFLYPRVQPPADLSDLPPSVVEWRLLELIRQPAPLGFWLLTIAFVLFECAYHSAIPEIFGIYPSRILLHGKVLDQFLKDGQATWLANAVSDYALMIVFHGQRVPMP